jgi:hypothetical protein
MKVGDLVRIKDTEILRYTGKWCQFQHPVLVARVSTDCLALPDKLKRWMPKKYFEVISEGR